MADNAMGIVSVEKQKKQGKPNVFFNKHHIPDDIESPKYKIMIDFLNNYNITIEQYIKQYENMSEISMNGSNVSDVICNSAQTNSS